MGLVCVQMVNHWSAVACSAGGAVKQYAAKIVSTLAGFSARDLFLSLLIRVFAWCAGDFDNA